MNSVLRWLAMDHLGSTAVMASETGARMAELRYKPWGETRYESGATPTTWRFTGQREDCRRRTIGLYFYNARYYDPALGRFVQPDTIVSQPGNPQALNRYRYVLNRPTILIDPTGHVAHPNCQGSGAAIADCSVDGWYGYEDYAVRKLLYEMGEREGAKVRRALLDIVSVLYEPVDYVVTIGACLSGDCSVLALAAMALPVVPGTIGRNVDEVVELANDTILKRAFRNDQDRFLRKGESGLSVHIGATNEQISAHLQGDILSVTYGAKYMTWEWRSTKHQEQ